MEVVKMHSVCMTPTKRMGKKANVEGQGKKGEATFLWYPSICPS